MFFSHSLLSSHDSSLGPLLANLLSSFIIQLSSLSLLFIKHKLCNTMHVATKSDIFFNANSDHFINNFNSSFCTLNVSSTHILIKYWIKFHFVSFPDNVIFPSFKWILYSRAHQINSVFDKFVELEIPFYICSFDSRYLKYIPIV